MAMPRIALVLCGGGARGLAHIGLLEVLEKEGLRPSFLVGTSMGGVVAALSAAGQPADRILELARGFRFPRWFIPGGPVTWDRIFAPAARALMGLSFDQLALPVAVVAVDLEAGRQAMLHEGPLLPALRRALRDVKTGAARSERLTLQIDPVCETVVSPRRQPQAWCRKGWPTISAPRPAATRSFVAEGADPLRGRSARPGETVRTCSSAGADAFLLSV